MDIDKKNRTELAGFLRLKRSKILPSQVNLPEGIRRRTPGLRREEVAYLADIGLTWYIWLEQGRQIKVSIEILNKLSNALMLSQEEKRYLFALAHQSIPTDLLTVQINIDKSIQNFIDSLKLSPAYILDQRWNILAWNKAACYLFGDFNQKIEGERNAVWLMFMDDYYKNLFTDWEKHAEDLVARFRSVYSHYTMDNWILDFIKKMCKMSKKFDYWWSQHQIQSIDSVNKYFSHPEAGSLEFECIVLDVVNNTNLKIFVHTSLTESTKQKMEILMNK